MSLQIKSAREARPYSANEYVGRALWSVISPLFWASPRPLFAWRAWLLRRFGARVGCRVHIYPSVKIVIPWNLVIGDDSSIGDEALVYNLGPVTIGSRATVSHRAHLCAGSHDYRDPTLPLLRLPISIGNDAWVCAQSLIGPGVVIGDGAVVGAGAVVMTDVPEWTVVAGNPAQSIKRRELSGDSRA